jgi:hypothetical protein
VINATAPEATRDRTPTVARSFKDYYAGTIVRPRATFDALIADDRRVRYGLIALAINAQLYILVYVLLSLGGAEPSSMKPWLAIPAASYYRFNELFLAPSMFICWILGAGVAQLLSRAASGKGSFEDMLGVLGFGISIACLPALLVDLPVSLLGAIDAVRMSQFELSLNSPGLPHEMAMLLYSLSITWSAVLFYIGIRSAQRIGRGGRYFG